MSHALRRANDSTDGTVAYYALACATTWLLAAPVARAWSEHAVPAPGAIACAGLSAFGPLIAAAVVAKQRGALREVFGRWRTAPVWPVLALFAPLAVHLVATALDTATGGHPEAWLHPPRDAERAAALIVFPLGEEFGWRGFAHPRLVRAFGPVRGPLLLGAMWGAWHLAYMITPTSGTFDLPQFALTMLELPLYSLLLAWIFERANRSMAVALAMHAGAHLDHIEWARDVRLQGCHLAVLAVLAVVAARALQARSSAERASGGGASMRA